MLATWGAVALALDEEECKESDICSLTHEVSPNFRVGPMAD